ncbi:hypothetical protein RclHR1_05930001 [Rhizophagus clarus]|uniref:Uncharacterized protein n=1 Tax=Rhizophagus clarus TaxID=94130 RepID=A0A2Z6RRG4_9GLOM|nr:hypothetical protein RclHR1_05930001 [Rhizophagus clarus]
MSNHKLPPNYYLHFYPPPPHPSPPPSLNTTTQKFLRFRDFYRTHFIQNRNFFHHALNSPTPWWSWKIEEGVEERSHQLQPEEYENYEYQEEYCEEQEVKTEEIEFVLSEEAIAMFRFSELRRQQLAEEISKANDNNNGNNNNKNNNDDNNINSNLQNEASSQSPINDNYLDTEPDPSLIPSFHNKPSVESQELYGSSCTIINTLEAAVNSTFVRSFNVSNKTTNNSQDEVVVYWPVLPLRFV